MIDDDIAYRLEACKGKAALGGQVVSVRANPDAAQTLIVGRTWLVGEMGASINDFCADGFLRTHSEGHYK